MNHDITALGGMLLNSREIPSSSLVGLNKTQLRQILADNLRCTIALCGLSAQARLNRVKDPEERKVGWGEKGEVTYVSNCGPGEVET